MNVTPKCQQVLVTARIASQRLGHAHLSSGHVLLGLLTVACGAAEALTEAGLTQESIERCLHKMPIRAEQTEQKSGDRVGSSASEAMRRAEPYAQATDCNYVGTEHVLLALLQEHQGDASDILDSHRVDRTLMSRLLFAKAQRRDVILWPAFESET